MRALLSVYRLISLYTKCEKNTSPKNHKFRARVFTFNRESEISVCFWFVEVFIFLYAEGRNNQKFPIGILALSDDGNYE